MRRTYVRRRVVALIVLVVGVWGLAQAATASLGSRRPIVVLAGAQRYVVKAGDTVWSVAERTAEGRDPREVVDDIVLANRIDAGRIVPGQVLLIPSRA